MVQERTSSLIPTFPMQPMECKSLEPSPFGLSDLITEEKIKFPPGFCIGVNGYNFWPVESVLSCWDCVSGVFVKFSATENVGSFKWKGWLSLKGKGTKKQGENVSIVQGREEKKTPTTKWQSLSLPKLHLFILKGFSFILYGKKIQTNLLKD